MTGKALKLRRTIVYYSTKGGWIVRSGILKKNGNMILTTHTNNIETFGDIKQFQASIDPKNFDFIATLLSSNLYSNPEESFIRETVSNAWDSEVEAGTTDQPVIMSFEKDAENGLWTITIRDFGTGLSPERFKETYVNIGSSTKRGSNKYMGCFGLGRFAGLACSQVVHINSYYEGTAYYYVMVKDGNKITFNLMMESPTEEKNGLEVAITGIDDHKMYAYRSAVGCTRFFPNVYIDGLPTETNTAKTKRFEYFAATDVYCNYDILVGNALYKCDILKLEKEAMIFMRMKRSSLCGIVIKFDIGELELTPNREEIIYTQTNLALINKRILDAKKEIDGMIYPLLKDTDDIREYCDIIKRGIKFDPITMSVHAPAGFMITDPSAYVNNQPLLYKGKDRSYWIEALWTIFTNIAPFYCAVRMHGQTVYNNYHISIPYNLRTLNAETIIMLKGSLTRNVKNYINGKYKECLILREFDKEGFYNELMTDMPAAMKATTFAKQMSDEVYGWLMKKVKVLDTENDKRYIEFLEERKKERLEEKKNADKRKKVNIYKHNLCTTSKYSYPNLEDCANDIRAFKKGVILMRRNDPNLSDAAQVAHELGYVCVSAEKRTYVELEEDLSSRLVDFEEITHGGRKLARYGTMMRNLDWEQMKHNLVGEQYEALMTSVPQPYKDKIDKMVYEYRRTRLFVYNKYAKEYGGTDEETKELCDKLNAYVKAFNAAEDLCGFIKANGIQTIHYSLAGWEDMVYFVIMRNKSYRLSYDAYRKIKKNALIKNLLWPKLSD